MQNTPKLKHMRSLLFIPLLILGLGCNTPKKTVSHSNKMSSAKLNGTWVPVQQEMGGTALPKIVYEKEKLILNDSNYTVIAESVDKGVVTYNGIDKMDIYGKEGTNSGKHFTAIYKFETDQLTVCYNLSGTAYPESFDTKGKPLYFLSVFKKVSTN